MKAIITGISGQDGYFLSQFLISKGYEVHGILRRNSSMTRGTMELLPDDIRRKIVVHYGDITNGNFLSNLLGKEKPDEIYHLAAQSFVGYSFQNALSTYDANIGGTLNVCNAVKDYSPDTRMYFAATSEMFGSPRNHQRMRVLLSSRGVHMQFQNLHDCELQGLRRMPICCTLQMEYCSARE